MQLKLTTDYGIRMVLCLASEKRMMNSREISKLMSIPRDYAVQVGGKLKRKGILNTYAGHQGGYTLGRATDEITLLDIVTALEDTTRINRCLEGDEFCSRDASASCPVRCSYVLIQEGIDCYLDSITVKDLLESNESRECFTGEVEHKLAHAASHLHESIQAVRSQERRGIDAEGEVRVYAAV